MLTRIVALALLAAHPAAAAADGLDGVTRNFILPTGELTPPGEVHWGQQQMIVAHTLGVGITDGLEIDLILPGLPFGGQAQLRASLLPRTSDVRLVVGGGVVLLPEIGVITTASATAAFHTEDLNVHASLMAYSGQTFDGQLGILSTGITWRFSRTVALIADVTRFSVPDNDCYQGPVTYHCQDVLDTATTYTFGIKLLGKKLDGDVGIMLVSELDYTPMPMITIHH